VDFTAYGILQEPVINDGSDSYLMVIVDAVLITPRAVPPEKQIVHLVKKFKGSTNSTNLSVI
jgi:hypothetical protein